jgi:predicted RNase H-like HicB family nuclease
MLSYPVRLAPEKEHSVKLAFPDLPEGEVVGPTEEDVFSRVDAELEAALAVHVVEGRPIPPPPTFAAGQP